MSYSHRMIKQYKRLLQQPALRALTCVWTLLIDRCFDSNNVSVQCKSQGRINKKKKAKKLQYPTFPDQYL